MADEMNDPKIIEGKASPAPKGTRFYIPLFWAGVNNLRVGQPTSNPDKANGLLRSLTGDRANAFIVTVQVPECEINPQTPPERQ